MPCLQRYVFACHLFALVRPAMATRKPEREWPWCCVRVQGLRRVAELRDAGTRAENENNRTQTHATKHETHTLTQTHVLFASCCDSRWARTRRTTRPSSGSVRMTAPQTPCPSRTSPSSLHRSVFDSAAFSISLPSLSLVTHRVRSSHCW